MRRHLAAASVSRPVARVHTSRLGQHWPTRITFSALDTWSVSLASTVTDRVALTATSSLTVTGSGYLIQIYDLTTNARVTSCSSGTTCSWSGVPSTAQDAYVAVVGSSQTTYPPTTVVATSQTVTPPAWTVSLALSGTTSPVLTATTNYSPSYAGRYLQIYDLTTGARVPGGSCQSTTCAVNGSPQTPQDTFIAVVGSSSSTYPPATVLASSATVTPAAWAAGLTLSGTTSPVLTATTNYSPSYAGRYLQIYDLTTGARVPGGSCQSTTCAVNGSPQTPQDTFIAVVGSSSSTYPPATVLARSATITPAAWTVNLTITGSPPYLYAVTNYSPSYAGRYLQIYDLSTGFRMPGGSCQSISCTANPQAGNGPFVAAVGSQSGTFPPATILAISNAVLTGSGGPTGPFETSGGGNPSELGHCMDVCQGDPINTATGEFAETYTDLNIPGRGPQLELTRTYGSQRASLDGPLGLGWSFDYGMWVAQDTAGSNAMNVHQENGSIVAFTPTGSGIYIPPSRALATLAHNTDGTWTFTRLKREIFTFSSSGKLLNIKDLNGYLTALAYDGSGRLSTVTDPSGRSLTFTYNAEGRITTVTDPAGRTVHYAYDGSGRLTSSTDPEQHATSYGYNTSNLMTTITDPTLKVITNTYDTSKRVITQTDPAGKAITFAYGGNGATTVTSPDGRVIIDTYADGQLVSQTRGAGTPQAATWTYSYDPATLGIATITDPNGHTRRYTYDPAGNTLSDTDGLDHQQSWTYDTLNNPRTHTDRNGNTTIYSYDARGNLTTVSRALGAQNRTTTLAHSDPQHPADVTASTDPNGKTSSYSYDTNGDLASVTDPNGNTTSYTYNTIGQRTSLTNPRTNITSYDYDNAGRPTTITAPGGHVTSYTYDHAGRQLSVTDPADHTTASSYDTAGRLITVTRPDGTTIGYGYDDDGNQTSYTDGAGHTTSYTYDPLGRLSQTSDPLSRVTSYGYDNAGNRTSMTAPGGLVTSYGYDNANRLTSISYSDSTTPSVGYNYDPGGRRTSMTDGNGTTGYSYDTLDRLTQTVSGSTTVRYGYDLAGHLTNLTYPDGRVVTRGYDDAGRLTSVNDGSGHTTSFGYNADSALTTTAYPNGITATTSYDISDWPTAVTDTRGGTTLASFTYTRGNDGALATETSTGLGQPDQTYTYDTLGQLQTANTSSYSYNDAGDITTAAGATLNYDNAHQLTSYTPANGPATSFGYDQRGDRAVATTAGTSISYGYDQANRLITYTPASGAATSYSYTGDGLRASKTSGGTTQNFTWDAATGAVPLLLTDGVTSYLYGPGNRVVEQIDAAGTVTYLQQDQLGSTRLLTDTAGAVTGTYNYDPHGNITSHTGDATALLFAGEYRDPESGLYYLRARYYDPATGQFLTRDPIEAITGQPYQYANNDPLDHSDPTGLFCGGPIFCPVVHTVQTVVDRGAPDYMNINFGAVAPVVGLFGLGGGASVTITRSGHIYVGSQTGVGVAGFSGSVRWGWLNQRQDTPTCNVDTFLHAQGNSVGGYAPLIGLPGVAGVGPSAAYSWNSQNAVEVGVGAGAGHDVSYSRGYNYRAWFDLPFGW
jgi:RHS repeat-associated protein